MAPLNLTSLGTNAEPIISILIGLGFGIILEQAGFGSAKKLTNQFYLNDMTVLKVMFTAIVTALLLVVGATTFGLLRFDELWVNPTYLGSGIVGGLLFGVGFVVGGYCPGTALVSAATLKVDGILFVLGVLVGILAFGYSEPLLDGFFNDVGSFGRFTLMDLTGLSMPVVALLVLALALLFFSGAEWIERLINRRTAEETPRRGFTLRGVRPAYRFAMTLAAANLLLIVVWPKTTTMRDRSQLARIEAQITQQKVQVSALELSDLMRDKSIKLILLDLRDEAAFNRNHLLDALRISDNVADTRRFPASAIKVLLADRETDAISAYRRLALERVENLYVLANGLPAWYALFDQALLAQQSLAALGPNHPTSRPPTMLSPRNTPYIPKVKRPGLGAKRAGGGCGG